MLLISCPNCGSRDETEFHYGGQAHVPYPENPNDLNDREWAEYLFYRENTKGTFAERWLHSTGCRQWFNMLRDTVTYDIQAVYPMGTPRPDLTATAAPESGTASLAADSTTTGTAAPSISGTSMLRQPAPPPRKEQPSDFPERPPRRRRTHRPQHLLALHRGRRGIHRATPATRSPRPCSPTAGSPPATRSTRTVPAASWPPGWKSPTRWSGSNRASPATWPSPCSPPPPSPWWTA